MPSKPLKAIKPMFSRNTWRIVRGDTVQITAGKDKGMQGKILRVLHEPRFPRVFVEGCNLMKRHITPANEPGFVVTLERPIHYSNVLLVDPVTGKGVRSKWMFTEQGEKVRVTKGANASGSVLHRPDVWKEKLFKNAKVGEKDTTPEEATRETYIPDAPILIRTLRDPDSKRGSRETPSLET